MNSEESIKKRRKNILFTIFYGSKLQKAIQLLFIWPFQGWTIEYITDRQIQVPDNWPVLGQGIIHNNQNECFQAQLISKELQCTQPPTKFLALNKRTAIASDITDQFFQKQH